jgi:hypothetical protein
MCTYTFQAWSLDASGVKACMAADARIIQNSRPMDIELAITNGQFKSEIFYQVDANRTRLVGESYDTSLLEDFKSLSQEMTRTSKESFNLTMEYEKLNPSPKMVWIKDSSGQSEVTPESMELIRIHDEKKAAYSNKVGAPSMAASQAYSNFIDTIGQNPNRPSYIREIESKIAEMGDQKRLKEYQALKSYGDYLLGMIKRASSCDELHSQYKKLAQEAKVKKNFQLEIISYTSFFLLHRLSARDQKRLDASVREMFKEEGYVEVARTFDSRKHQNLGLLGAYGQFADTMSLLSSGKSSAGPLLNSEVVDQSVNSDQLEAILAKDMKADQMRRHQDVQDLVLSYIK